MKTRNGNLTGNAQALRKNMTEEERKLWYAFLNNLRPHFYRQRVTGKYILDFYCPAIKLAIEVDGLQHYTDEGENADINRDNYLNGLGIEVLRFSNIDINQNFESVCKTIYSKLNKDEE